MKNEVWVVDIDYIRTNGDEFLGRHTVTPRRRVFVSYEEAFMWFSTNMNYYDFAITPRRIVDIWDEESHERTYFREGGSKTLLYSVMCEGTPYDEFDEYQTDIYLRIHKTNLK